MQSDAASEPACQRASLREETPKGPYKYRPRDPSASPLFRLIDTYYQHVKGLWEDLLFH